MRLKFRKQASKMKQEQAQPKIYSWQGLTKLTQLTTILFLLIGSWVNTKVAQAETARIDDITIDRQPDETYESLIGRAEAAARSAVQQGFNQSAQVTDVSVVVLGQNQGTIAPVLVVELSRPEWNNSTQNGITYFGSARSLLRLDEQQLANTNPNQSPEQDNVPAPPGGQQNNSSSPGSSREVINSTPAQQSDTPTLPGATPLPGGPTLTPRPQEPATTPATSPGNTSTPPVDTSTPNSNTGTTNPTPANNDTGTTNPTPINNDTGTTNSTPINSNTGTTNPTPINNDTPQITGPTPINQPSPPTLPQGTPSNNTSPNTTPTQF